MGYVLPPPPLTLKQFNEAKGKGLQKDIKLMRWARYANGFGMFRWLWDWIRGKLI